MIRIWAPYDYWPNSDEQPHRLRWKSGSSNLPSLHIVQKIEERLEIYRVALLVHPPFSREPVRFARLCLCSLYEGVIWVEYKSYRHTLSVCAICPNEPGLASGRACKTNNNQGGDAHRTYHPPCLHGLFPFHTNPSSC